MTIETLELDKLMLENSISQFRNIPEYVKICEAFSVGAISVQDAVNYLSNMMDLDKSEGVWLDYLAWLVGTSRSTFDVLPYFCLNQTGYFTYYAWTNSSVTVYTLKAQPEVDDTVFSDTDATEVGIVSAYADGEITVSEVDYTRNSVNDVMKPAGDLNVEKLFYFEGISSLESGDLQDVYLKKKVKAKIAYNTSKATRNENIKIIQGLTNADKVVIRNVRNYDNFTQPSSSVTISTNGTASGFTSTAFINTGYLLNTSKAWTIYTGKVNFSNVATIQTIFCSSYKNNAGTDNTPINVNLQADGKIRMMLSSTNNYGSNTPDIASGNIENIGTKVYSANTDYYFKLEFTGTKYLLSYSTDGINWTTDVQQNSTTAVGAGYICIGARLFVGIIGNPFLGSIDLNDFKIFVDDKLAYQSYTTTPMLLDISLYGNNIFYPSIESIRNTIENILGAGVGIRNLAIL